MTKKTQIIALVALVLLLVSGIGLWFVSSEVTRIGRELTAAVQRIADQRAQEQQLSELITLIDATKVDRNELGQYLLSEADTITFLADIERIGVQQGVVLTTNSLAVTDKQGASILNVAFTMVGQEELVLRMLDILENLPYESSLITLNLNYAELTELDVSLTLTLY